MKTGLVSVTFRQLPVADIIGIAAKAGLAGIEWGSDIHVTTPRVAAKTAILMREAGLESLSLGSYYCAGRDGSGSFEAALATAVALQAKNIRIWAGPAGSAGAERAERQRVAKQIHLAAERAAADGITLSLEYHGNTLTDTPASVFQLLEEVCHDNVYIYWQPLEGMNPTENVNTIQKLAKMERLMHLHVYHWRRELRLPLADGQVEWGKYLRAASGAARAALLEFVREDNPAQLMWDAAVLQGLLP